jgi:hypothetical protein
MDLTRRMKNLIFTITTGRSGTVYLTELLRRNLPNGEVHHERFGYQDFSVETPDASHFMLFNSAGNVKQVQDFWEQKLVRNVQTSADWYVEISHVLSKAGLLENLHHLAGHAVHIVILTRNVEDVAWSFYNRFDFFNFGFTWLFSLDPRYPNKLVTSADLMKAGMRATRSGMYSRWRREPSTTSGSWQVCRT